MLKEVSEIPEEGQFVVVWQHNDKIWSCTYKKIGHKLYLYSKHIDNWIRIDYCNTEYWQQNSFRERRVFIYAELKDPILDLDYPPSPMALSHHRRG